jgi:hypothetical protein
MAEKTGHGPWGHVERNLVHSIKLMIWNLAKVKSSFFERSKLFLVDAKSFGYVLNRDTAKVCHDSAYIFSAN